MKRLMILSAVLLISASTLSAQNLTLGGRYSNYSTSFEFLETGRASSVGAVGEYRAGLFVLNGRYDHDFDSGISFDFLPIDLAQFSRDRGEVAIGFAVLPFLDIVGGGRVEELRLESASFFGDRLFDDTFSLDHTALMFGASVHSRSIRPIGWYGNFRGYAGEAEYTVEGLGLTSDTTGYSVEVGFPIPVGLSGWEVTPGAEFENIEFKDDLALDLNFETNRFFVNLSYSFGR